MGSFESNSRTLYVGHLNKDCGEDLDALLWKHFSEWGEVENINVRLCVCVWLFRVLRSLSLCMCMCMCMCVCCVVHVHVLVFVDVVAHDIQVIYRKSIAFVRYRLRSNAEFARIAMGNQDLGHKEVLNMRWAMDDPNPVARRAAERADADAIAAMLQAKGASLESTGYSYPVGYTGPHLPEADDVDVGAGAGAGAGAAAGAIGPALPPASAPAEAPGVVAPGTVAPGAVAPGTAPVSYAPSDSSGVVSAGTYEAYFAKFTGSGSTAAAGGGAGPGKHTAAMAAADSAPRDRNRDKTRPAAE